MPNGDGINWQLLQNWFEARAEVIADKAADKAVEKGRRDMVELVSIHSVACDGRKHAANFGRLLWIIVGSAVVATFGAAVAIVKASI